jgi:hypothetical protein
VDSTLDYPISLNHPYYYEENWRKEYKYVLAAMGGYRATKIENQKEYNRFSKGLFRNIIIPTTYLCVVTIQ